ncbi:DUF2314 domain-containing protein [uncultured Pelagimonas sp.]|uniref:DUF2314 domain-containing protein n=1 Tax=uncultured Pelagimonas sp. TaxID=1618102 RepID=UPI00263640CF|nr:DUF2314 domain-containing protein [uncultured Pelagimonas sp.]
MPVIALVIATTAQADAPKRVISSDYQISQAWAAARATLPTAIGALEKRNGWFSPSLAFKVALPVDHDAQVEMLWVDKIRRQGNVFKARLASHPHHMPGKRMGHSVEFFYDQIADWAVQAVDGRYYGYYTTRVLLKSMEPERAAKYRALLVENPLPPEWRFNPEE